MNRLAAGYMHAIVDTNLFSPSIRSRSAPSRLRFLHALTPLRLIDLTIASFFAAQLSVCLYVECVTNERQGNIVRYASIDRVLVLNGER